jgi:GNAT superfamily N-acetyltransferase
LTEPVAAATTPLYVVHGGEPLRDRDTVLSLWSGNLGQQDRIASKYDWFYLGCPHGPPLLQLLRHTPSDSWVGTACAGRRRMHWQGREIRAGVLVDLAVVPEHRSLGPALILQQGLIEAGMRQLDLLYGFPNPKAAAVFKRIGYSRLTDIVRHARVLRHGRYLRSKMPGWMAVPVGAVADIAFALVDTVKRLFGARINATWSERSDARMDALWSASPQGDGPVGVRDSTHAKWRFDDCPLERTRYLMLTPPGRDDLQAWFATHVEGETLHVRDYWSTDGINGIASACLLVLLAAAREAGHASVSVEIAASEAHVQAWARHGFVARGRRPVFGRWSAAQDAGAAPQLFLTSADEDE